LNKEKNLDQIQRELAKMIDLVQKGIREVTTGLVERKENCIVSAIKIEPLTDQLEREIEKLSVSTMALCQPVSKDLRFLVASLYISSDLERIGDLVLNIANASLIVIQKPPLKPYVDIPRMCETLISMMEDARLSLLQKETSACEKIAKKDTIIDTLYHKIWRELLSYMLGDATTIELAETILHIAKQFERIGDHITNIAERICFMQTGKIPDLNE
jgi:phosphate transport system protein